MEVHSGLKKSLLLLVGAQFFYSAQAHADCPLGASKVSPLMCNSYEFGMPVNITNPTGNPSLTVMDGHVGIGTLSPAARLDTVYGVPSGNSADSFVSVKSGATVNTASNYTGTISGVQGRVSTGSSQSGTISSAHGVSGNVYHAGTGTLVYASGLQAGVSNLSSGVVTNAYGVGISVPVNSGGGVITNYFGVYIDTPTAATNNFSIYSKGAKNYFGGTVGVGTENPGSELDVLGTIRTDQICDRSGANCKTISAGWSTGGGSGSVTNIDTGTGLLGGPITTSGTLSVDVGTTANKIVQLNGSAQLPAVSGVNLTDINASKIAGKNVSAFTPSADQFLSFDGTSWVNKSVAISDVTNLSVQLNNKIDASNMPANCGANQSLTFSSPLGAWSCSDIVFTAASLGSQSANTVLASPDGVAGNATFRKITTADLSSSIVDSLWTISGSHINRPTGNVGIGVANPTTKLAVAGEIQSVSGGFRFPDGSLQTTAASSSGGSTGSPTFAMISAYNATSVTAASTWTKVSFGLNPSGSTNILQNVTFNDTDSRLIPLKSGYYRISLAAEMSTVGSGAGSMRAAIYINGNPYKITRTLINYTSSFTQTVLVDGLAYLNGSTDYVEGYVWFNGTNTVTVNAGQTATTLSLDLIQ
ncbi:hypothetical protein [Bdellovibrio sp. BCCA]|uniref:hypothetical protein n=1 Tax=Bdellovibrio sp. BCCA TaxID=3136281 RepID=UPI0030F08C18